uniref:EF-hand domain-containing protein n=1 Tax=Globodera pallida TaxID=36090 RepID=A0A183CGE3_GLOPA
MGSPTEKQGEFERMFDRSDKGQDGGKIGDGGTREKRSLTDADADAGTSDKKRSRREEPERPKDFTFDAWRERYLVWNKKTPLSHMFRRIDKFGTGMVPRKLFIDEIVASKFLTTEQEMARVADEFDNGDGLIDSTEFMNALRFAPQKMRSADTDSAVAALERDFTGEFTKEFGQVYPTLDELMEKARDFEKQPQQPFQQQVHHRMFQQQSDFGGYGQAQKKSYAAAAATCAQQIQQPPGGQTAHQPFQQVQHQYSIKATNRARSDFGGYGQAQKKSYAAAAATCAQQIQQPPGGQTAHQPFQQRPPRYVRQSPPKFPCQLSNCDKVCNIKI